MQLHARELLDDDAGARAQAGDVACVLRILIEPVAKLGSFREAQAAGQADPAVAADARRANSTVEEPGKRNYFAVPPPSAS